MTASYENLIYITAHDLALNLTSNVINHVPDHRTVFIGPTDTEVTDLAQDQHLTTRYAQLAIASAVVDALGFYFTQDNILAPQPRFRHEILRTREAPSIMSHDLLYLAYNFAASKKNSVLARVSPTDFESAMKMARIAVGYREETNWSQTSGPVFEHTNPMRDVGVIEIRFLAKVTPSA